MKLKQHKEAALMEDLRALLVQGTASTQESICNTLAAGHPHINQSKISRMLHKLGAIKTKNDQGQIIYRLPKEPLPPSTTSPLSSLIIKITHNENNILIFTSPGSASLIARLLDYKQDSTQILGAIAGDDTILVVPKSVKRIDKALTEIKHLLFNTEAVDI